MNCWMLQCNINYYRFLDSMILHKNDFGTWGIKYHIPHVNLKDTVYIWLTKYRRVEETEGIYAAAEITGLPTAGRRGFAWEDLYWIDSEARKRHDALPVVMEIHYITVFGDNPILRAELEVAGLQHLHQVMTSQHPFYKLTLEECKKVRKVVGDSRGKKP